MNPKKARLQAFIEALGRYVGAEIREITIDAFTGKSVLTIRTDRGDITIAAHRMAVAVDYDD